VTITTFTVVVGLLAAALAATAAMQGDFGRPSSSPGMPVRRPRRPAAASAAVAADAEPDLSCAVEDERTAKPPIGEVSSLSVGLSVSRWVCLV
jgi:hypothetical protein